MLDVKNGDNVQYTDANGNRVSTRVDGETFSQCFAAVLKIEPKATDIWVMYSE